jgi:hypothetical protein
MLLPCCLSAQTDDLSAVLKAHIQPSGKHPVNSILFHVEEVEKGNIVQGSMGHTKKDGEAVQPNTPFKIASITKTLVATVILQLVEENKLQLDDRIVDFLKELDFLALDRIHLFNKQSSGERITVKAVPFSPKRSGRHLQRCR